MEHTTVLLQQPIVELLAVAQAFNPDRFAVCGVWVSRSNGAYFPRACQAMDLLGAPDADIDSISELMPKGGPPGADIPEDARPLTLAALLWASSVAHLPAAWLALPPGAADFLLGICGRPRGGNTGDTWIRDLALLRDLILARPRALPPQPPTGAGATIRIPHDNDDSADPDYFQFACDDLGITLPTTFAEMSLATLRESAPPSLPKDWPLWISIRELMAASCWARTIGHMCTNWGDAPWDALGRADLLTLCRVFNAPPTVLADSSLHQVSFLVRLLSPGWGNRAWLPSVPTLGSAFSRAQSLRWLGDDLPCLHDPARAFRALLETLDTYKTALSDVAAIQAVIDLSPPGGIPPTRIPEKFQVAAALAFTWALLAVKVEPAWSNLNAGPANFLIALCGYQPSSNLDMRRSALHDIRAIFFRARPGPARADPCLVPSRATPCTAMFWVESGMLQPQQQLTTSLQARCDSFRIPLPKDGASIALALADLLSRFDLPADFIPPMLQEAALAVLSLALRICYSLSLRHTISDDAMSLLLAASGRHPTLDPLTRPGRVASLVAQLRAMTQVASPPPAARMEPARVAPASTAPRPVEPFFFNWLARASGPGIKWPLEPELVLTLLAAAPQLPVYADTVSDAERAERAFSLVWAWTLLGTRADGPDTPWALPPGADLAALVTWLAPNRLLPHGSAIALGKAARRAAELTFQDSALRGLIQAYATALPDSSPFYLDPVAVDRSPEVCEEFFTLACISGNIPLPNSSSDCYTLLTKLEANFTLAADATQRDHTLRELAAAATWANHYFHLPVPRQGSTALCPCPLPVQALAVLLDLFPGNGTEEGSTFGATILRASRRWASPAFPRPGSGGAVKRSRPDSDPDPPRNKVAQLHAKLETAHAVIHQLTLERDAAMAAAAAATPLPATISALRTECSNSLLTISSLANDLRTARAMVTELSASLPEFASRATAAEAARAQSAKCVAAAVEEARALSAESTAILLQERHVASTTITRLEEQLAEAIIRERANPGPNPMANYAMLRARTSDAEDRARIAAALAAGYATRITELEARLRAASPDLPPLAVENPPSDDEDGQYYGSPSPLPGRDAGGPDDIGALTRERTISLKFPVPEGT
jgi:hypothetical protein